MFATRNDTCISGHNLWKRVSEAARAAGLPKVGVHDLRHSILNNLITGNVPINVVSGIAGHASTTTTTRFYSSNRISDEAKTDAMRSVFTPEADAGSEGRASAQLAEATPTPSRR